MNSLSGVFLMLLIGSLYILLYAGTYNIYQTIQKSFKADSDHKYYYGIGLVVLSYLVIHYFGLSSLISMLRF